MCGLTFPHAPELHAHLQKEKHCGVQRNDPSWKDAQYVAATPVVCGPSGACSVHAFTDRPRRYLFPTYENDALLTSFADFSSDEEVPERLSRQDQERMLRDVGMGELLEP